MRKSVTDKKEKKSDAILGKGGRTGEEIKWQEQTRESRNGVEK